MANEVDEKIKESVLRATEIITKKMESAEGNELKDLTYQLSNTINSYSNFCKSQKQGG